MANEWDVVSEAANESDEWSVVSELETPKEKGFIDSTMDFVGDKMNAVRDFATGAAPKKESVLQGIQMNVPAGMTDDVSVEENRYARDRSKSQNSVMFTKANAYDSTNAATAEGRETLAKKQKVVNAAAQTRDFGAAIDDLKNAYASGSAGAVALPINLIAPSSEFAEYLRGIQKDYESQISPEMQARQELMVDRINNEEGFAGKYIETISSLLTNPSLGMNEIVKQVPNFVGVLGASKFGSAIAGLGVRAAGMAAPGTIGIGEAISGGAIGAAAKSIGAQAGGLAGSVAMTAGDAAGNTYDELVKTNINVWRMNPDFRALVQSGVSEQDAIKQVATAKSRLAALAAAPLGLLGYAGAEASIIGGQAAKLAGKNAALQGFGKILAKDLIGENIEEGGTQFLSNLATRQVDQSKGALDGVAQAAATATIASGPMSGIAAYNETRPDAFVESFDHAGIAQQKLSPAAVLQASSGDEAIATAQAAVDSVSVKVPVTQANDDASTTDQVLQPMPTIAPGPITANAAPIATEITAKHENTTPITRTSDSELLSRVAIVNPRETEGQNEQQTTSSVDVQDVPTTIEPTQNTINSESTVDQTTETQTPITVEGNAATDAGVPGAGNANVQATGLSARQVAINAEIERARVKKEDVQTARVDAQKPVEGLRVGPTPNSTEPVSVKNGIVHIGKYPAQNYDTGEDVKVSDGASNEKIAQALKSAGALSGKARVFGLNPARERLTTPVAQRDLPTAPVDLGHVGKDNVPMVDGGVPFKKNSDAKKAKKQQPLMRVIKVDGGFALAPKTEAQIKAQEAAGKRLSNSTGNTGLPMSAHEFVAREGGLSKDLRSNLGVEGNPRIGAKRLYAGTGGLTIEQASEKLKEAGYLTPDSTHSQAFDLIRKSLTNPQYTADGTEAMAQAAIDTRFEDHLAALQDAAQDENFDPFAPLEDHDFSQEDATNTGYDSASPELKAEIAALANHLDNLGGDAETIINDIAMQNPKASDKEFHELAKAAINEAIAKQEAITGSNRDSGKDDGQQAQTPAGSASQEVDLLGEVPNASQQAAENLRQKQKETEQAQRNAAPTSEGFALGMVDQKTGSDVAVGQAELKPAEQATAILDAANVTGKERIDVLKDVKQGAITPDELKAAYPAKATIATMFSRGTNGAVTNQKDVVGNQGGRSADDTTPGVKPKHSPEQMAKWAAEKKARDEARMIESNADREMEKRLARRSDTRIRNSDMWGHFTDSEKSDIDFYSDATDKIDEGKKATINAIERALKNAGITIEHTSSSNDGKSKSLYVKLGDQTIRVSDHELPMTPSRENDRSRGLTGKWDREVIVSEWQNSTMDEYLSEIGVPAAKRLGYARSERNIANGDTGNTTTNESTAPDSGGAFSRKVGQADTAAFKKWFADSKVVDADGKPMVVYHGTNKTEHGEAFTQFDTYASNYGLMGMGGYFTADPSVASSYTTKGRGESPTVYKVYLSIKNPIDMEGKADVAAWEKQFDGIGEYHEGGETNESWYRAAEDLITDQDVPKYEGAEIMQDGLRMMGFDGITHMGGGRVKKDGVTHRVYIAFDPEQIKSATGNNGQFDGTNPDIRFSRSIGNTTTVAALQSAIKDLVGTFGTNKLGRIVATTAADIKSTWEPFIGSTNLESEGDAGKAQAFFDPKTNTVFLIADHIEAGTETAVLAHELMHKHGKAVLGEAGWNRLHSVISSWENAEIGSDEHFVYSMAMESVEAVGLELSTEELFPYAVEAAIKMGIRPNMQASRGTVAHWLESVRQNLKQVWAKITGKPETFKAQDLVNLAFGIAQMENPENGPFDLRSGLEKFAEADDLYALPKSTSKDLKQIAKDNGEEVTVRTIDLVGEKLHTLIFKDGTEIRISDRKASPYGQDQQVYAFELIDGTAVPTQIGRPGENPEDVPPTDDVWIDVSKNTPGSLGSKAYNIAATFAYNNGKIFIGDPAGLSDKALRRRTEQMLSSALKFGTTDHLAPHPRQIEGDAKLGVPPLKWVYGDHIGNIERMIDVSLESLENSDSGAKDDTRYDQSTGGFTDKSGQAVPRKSTMGRDLASYIAGVNKAQAGWRTLARTAFLRSFLGPNGRAEGSGILDRASNDVAGISSNKASGSAYPTTERIFYSRGNVAAQGLPEETRMQKVQRVMQDKYNRVKLIQDLLLDKGGVVGEEQDVYRAEERMHGRVHEVLRDFADDVVHPLIKKAVDFKIDLNELATYSYAKHAKERNAHIQKTNKNVKTGSGMSDAEADNIIQLVELSRDKDKFEELHQDLLTITSTTRRLMLDEGLITQDQYDSLESQYENYVPLRGFEDVDPDSGSVRPGLGRGFQTKGKETIAAMGRDSKAGDIIENIIRDYERVTIRAERNAVGKTFLDLVTSNPDPKLWEVQPVTRATRKVSGLVEYVDVADKGDETISVKVAGEQVYIKINDPLLLRAMQNTFKAETSDAERFLANTLGTYTSLLRNTITRYNPAFGVINAVRDVQMGAMGVYDELGAEGVRRYAANYGAAVAASGRTEMGKSDPQNKNMDKWMREMRFAGGTTGGVFMRDHETIRAELRDAMLQAGAKPNGVIEGIRSSKAWWATGKLLHGLELIGSMSENSARLAAYATAREMGKTPAQAASIAKNLTVNFNRFGEQGQLINTAFLFYNASVQGSVRIFQMAKNPKVRYAMAGMAAAGFGLAMMAASVGGDDEDGQPYWDKIPDFEKERNLIIMLPPGMDIGEKVGTHGRYIKIPMAYGLNVFPVLGYQLADLARNASDPSKGISVGKAAINMFSAVAGSYNPAGGSFDPRDKVQLAMAVSPTIVDAGIQMGAGVDSFGKPTGPQKSPYDKRPDSENVSAQNHGNVNHRIARWINEATGGNAARSGAIDIEPGTLKNMQGIVGGGLGKFVGDVVNLGYLGVMDAPIQPRDIPIYKAFYGEYDAKSGMSLFYERSKKALEEFDDMKSEQKLGIKRDYSDDEKFLQSMGAYAKNISEFTGKLKQQEVHVSESNSTPKEKDMKRRMIQRQREKMAEAFNAKWYEKESRLKKTGS